MNERTELSPEELFAKASGGKVDEPEAVETVEETPKEAAPEVETPEEPETPDVEPVEEVAAEEPEQTEPEKKGFVPSSVHRELGDRARKAEAEVAEKDTALAQMQAQMAQLQQMFVASQQQQPQAHPQHEPEPLDPFTDPEAFVSSLTQKFEAKLRNVEINNSLNRALDRFQGEAEEAFNWINTNGSAEEAARYRAMPDPGTAIVQAYRQHKLMEQTGGDLDAYTQRAIENALQNDPAMLSAAVERLKAAAPARDAKTGAPHVELAPSVNQGARAMPAEGSARRELTQAERFAKFGAPQRE